MVERSDIGSWLDGPPVGGGAGPTGGRLGLPAQGRGALAPLGRRVLALLVDWIACQAIAVAFFGSHPLVPLLVFAVENLLLVGTLGSTLGHRLLGLRVRRVAAPRSLVAGGDPEGDRAPRDPGPDLPAGPLRALVRTAALCLVLPAVVWDADGRGLHDRLAGTAIVRR